MKKLLVIDTETTGLDINKNHVWQIAGYYRNKNGNLFTLNLKCCPPDVDELSDEVLNLCKITREELKSYASPRVMYESFRLFLLNETADDDEKITWCGYNCPFDLSFVQKFFMQHDSSDSIFKFFYHQSIDMLTISTFLKSVGLLNTPTLKLGEIYKLMGRDEDTAHDALTDAEVTYQFYEWTKQIFMKGTDNGNK